MTPWEAGQKVCRDGGGNVWVGMSKKIRFTAFHHLLRCWHTCASLKGMRPEGVRGKMQTGNLETLEIIVSCFIWKESCTTNDPKWKCLLVERLLLGCRKPKCSQHPAMALPHMCQLWRLSSTPCGSTTRWQNEARSLATRASRLGRRSGPHRGRVVLTKEMDCIQHMTPQNLLSFLMPRPLPTPFVSTRPLQKSCWATTSSATTASRLGIPRRGAGGPWNSGTQQGNRAVELWAVLWLGPFSCCRLQCSRGGVWSFHMTLRFLTCFSGSCGIVAKINMGFWRSKSSRRNPGEVWHLTDIRLWFRSFYRT